ncbi:MAG: hypothetical protein QM762_19190 [Chryseolinea sp.]
MKHRIILGVYYPSRLMSKQKKVFRIIVMVFAALLIYASYDIARRTTFPGSKPQLKERIEKNFMHRDSSGVATEDAIADSTADSVRLKP